jgi:hypothetical protein
MLDFVWLVLGSIDIAKSLKTFFRAILEFLKMSFMLVIDI